jgi:hypothetical protein
MTPIRHWHACIRVSSVAAVIGLLIPALALRAQTINDARFTVGVTFGDIGSNYSWDVPIQLISSSNVVRQGLPFLPDSFHLHRATGSSATFSARVTYFPGPHIGFVGELQYLGLRASTSCSVVADNGDPDLPNACRSITDAPKTGAISVIEGGLVLRPMVRSVLQPYVAGLIGMAQTPSSIVKVESNTFSTTGGAAVLTVYTDPDWASIRPAGAVAAGFTTAAGTHFLFRFEVRDTWLSLPAVTGPTPEQGSRPPTRSVLSGHPSAVIGFDVVLGMRRGKRY